MTTENEKPAAPSTDSKVAPKKSAPKRSVTKKSVAKKTAPTTNKSQRGDKVSILTGMSSRRVWPD